jgi:hypothetical protein
MSAQRRASGARLRAIMAPGLSHPATLYLEKNELSTYRHEPNPPES